MYATHIFKSHEMMKNLNVKRIKAKFQTLDKATNIPLWIKLNRAGVHALACVDINLNDS